MPGYRGRLIWPFAATVARLDTASTLADTGGGAFAQGYDHVFREPQVVDGGDGADDTSTRQETVSPLVPCQVRTEHGNFEKLAQMMSGTVKDTALQLVFHYVDLETLGLVDTDGSALFKINDRLVSLHRSDGTLVRDFSNTPVYATHVQDRSWGLSGLERNLLLVTFEDREKSVVSV